MTSPISISPADPKKPTILSNISNIPGYKLLQNETTGGAVIIACFLLIFLSTPLFRIWDSYYSAADITQFFSLTYINPPRSYMISNPLLSDTIFSYNSFYNFNRESLWSGKIPLWNPYNSGGVPHLANYQSAFFSIFTIPFYFLPFKLALLLTAFMKLYSIGLFTFLYLKLIKLRQIPALLGAISFMFSGYNVVWLHYTVTAVVVTLPASLYFSEKLFKKYEADQDNSNNIKTTDLWNLLGLSLSLLVGLLAAHPETFFYALLLIAGYILFRLGNLTFEFRQQAQKLKSILALSGKLILAGLTGLLLSAIQLVPFAEYVFNSIAVTDRVDKGIHKFFLNFTMWPLAVFPDTLGNYSTYYRDTFLNYNEVNGQYIGSVAVLLAVFSLRFFFRNKYIKIFSITGIIWLFYSFNWLGFNELVSSTPLLKFGHIGRSYPIWLFSVSCCAALFVNHLLAQPTILKTTGKFNLLYDRRFKIGVVCLIALLFLLSAISSARDMVAFFYPQLQQFKSAFYRYVPGHIWYVGITFGAGLLAIIGLFYFSRYRSKLIVSVILLITVFLQNGFMLKEYNPTVDNRFFYPATPALGRLREMVKDRTVLMVGWDALPVNMNLLYKFSVVPNYDSLWVNNYERLLREFFGVGENTIAINLYTSSEQGMKLFGVEYFIPRREPLTFDLALSDIMFPVRRVVSNEILAGQTYSQTFVPKSPDLRQILISPHLFGRTNECTLVMKLEEVNTGAEIARKSEACSNLKEDTLLEFNFPVQHDSLNKAYRFSLTSPDAVSGQAAGVYLRPGLSYPDGSFTIDQKLQPGGLDFDYSTGNVKNFTSVGKADHRRVYKYDRGLGRYFTVSEARSVTSDQETRAIIRSKDFDPYRTVLLSAADQPVRLATAEPAAPAQILNEDAEDIRLKVVRQTPGYLVLTRSYYPGWKIEVNGAQKPLIRANYAFNAVEVGAGESVIRYYYDPVSFKAGALISFVTIFGIIGAIVRTKRNNKFKSRESIAQ